PRVRGLVARIAAHEQHFGTALKLSLGAIHEKEPRDPGYKVTRTRCGKDANLPGGVDFLNTSCVIDVKYTDANPFKGVTAKTPVGLAGGTVADGRFADERSATADATLRPAGVPAEHASAKPWAIVHRTDKSIFVVRVSP